MTHHLRQADAPLRLPLAPAVVREAAGRHLDMAGARPRMWSSSVFAA